MKNAKWLMVLFAVTVLFKGHGVLAEENNQKLGEFDPYHDFVIAVKNSVDRDTLYSIRIVDEQGKDAGTYIYPADDPRKVIIQAPDQGYNPQHYYSLILPEDVISVDGKDYKLGGEPWFSVLGEPLNKVTGEFKSFNEKTGQLALAGKNGIETLLITANDTFYLQTFSPRNKLSLSGFLYQVEGTAKPMITCERFPGSWRCILESDSIKGKFTSFNRLNSSSEPYQINLVPEGKDTVQSFPLDRDAIFYENTAWGTERMNKAAFVDKLNAANRASVEYRLSNGIAMYYVDIESYTGFYIGSTGSGSLIDPNNVLVRAPGADYPLRFPALNDTRYFQRTSTGLLPISKSDFMSALWMGRATVTYEPYVNAATAAKVHALILEDRGTITSGAFGGFIGNSRGITSIALIEDGKRTLMRIPLVESGAYHVYTGPFEENVSKAQFIRAFSLTKKARVSNMVKDGVSHYVMWEPLN